VQELFYQEYLSKFGQGCEYTCACGQRHRIETEQILFGRDILSEVSALVSETRGRDCGIWILSDENTEQAAGCRLKKSLRGFRVEQTILPGLPKPEPTIENVQSLCETVRTASPDLLISVGGGTISDMVKKISHDTGIGNWCVVTCASVDAFTSGKAAIWFKGYHRAVPSKVSEIVVCDLSVLEEAPLELFLSGMGDLLGKYLAYLDWHLSHLVTGEPICEEASRFGLESARRALVAAENFSEDRQKATHYLADAVLTSGLLMQSVGSSRPAASAEHTIAHFWEMYGTVQNKTYDLHGILVGLASLLVLEAYRDFFARLKTLSIDVPGRIESFQREPTWEETLGEEILPFKFKLVEEMEGKGAWTQKRLEERLVRFQSNRREIEALASEQMEELERAIEILSESGFPFSFAHLEVKPESAFLPFPYERYLRDRYTAFDLMYELGVEQQTLEKLQECVFERRRLRPDL
jgi:glycerol-1-phosphate dehydrogenase [NAD(P)+]